MLLDKVALNDILQKVPMYSNASANLRRPKYIYKFDKAFDRGKWDNDETINQIAAEHRRAASLCDV